MSETALVSEKLLSWVWKILLLLAVAVPIEAIVLVWNQNNFDTPMPDAVRDSILTNPLVFSVFIGLTFASFGVQYLFGAPERRKHEIRLRIPILIFIGPVAVLIISLLAWWQSNSSLIAALSEVVQKPLVLGAVASLTGGSLILALATSAREDRRRVPKVIVTLASVFLMFGGPTYLIYALQTVRVPYSFAVLIGLISFLGGMFIFLRFVSKEIPK